jgi:hypothetical protein
MLSVEEQLRLDVQVDKIRKILICARRALLSML